MSSTTCTFDPIDADEYNHYAQKWADSSVVFKISGSIVDDHLQMYSLISDISHLLRHSVMPVVVHGGGPQITKAMFNEGIQTEFIDGLRITDSDAARITQDVLSNNINRKLAHALSRSGIFARGFNGESNGLISAEQMDSELGFVGEIDKVDVSDVRNCCKEGGVPVISTMGRDKNDWLFNINADTAAAKIAVAMEADKIFYFTDVAGLYEDYNDPDTLISEIYLHELMGKIIDGSVSDGMIPKLSSCVRALEGGVEKAHIISGKMPHAILLEMLKAQGVGTTMSA